MCHGQADSGLCADAEVVDYAVPLGEVFLAQDIQELVEVHIAPADSDDSMAGKHIARAVGVHKHGVKFLLRGLANAGFGSCWAIVRCYRGSRHGDIHHSAGR